MKKLTAMTMISILAASITMPIAAMAQTGQAEIQASVTLREQPSTSGAMIRYLKAGENVTVLSEVNAYWLQVRDGAGRVGYMSSADKYIEFTAPDEAVSAPSTANAVAASSASFRTGPSTGAERIRYLKTGEPLTIIGQPNSYWYQVQDQNGVQGYVSSDPKYVTTNYTGGTGGGSTGGGAVQTPAVDTNAAIEAVIAAGMKYWGTPYEYSSDRSTTTTFDCSDFVRTAFREGMGLTLPADSRQQGEYVKSKGAVKTDWRSLKRGDLMLFMSYKGTSASNYAGVNKSTATITHVGIYLGDGKVLHTYSTESGGVRTNDIAGTHWEHRFLYGGSAL
ncbi:SH3 domain-containing C40 family peptidase [Paenibacillus methanolicus]|uniref:Cell wall-associated NlpC family hydrolase n=1 Tax=Paenibacillus methanolicus TaxID=582686 RepID=A0A5S5BVQ0_9BACL|nr:SH3 domain-containing C40 family peptidase [Paenibacillus methanolicus]TYP70262.1 cell wall-associated NlpC family hydrolase [Paenibacillus methanolicus]